MQIPGGFAELGVGEAPAVCWFRKEVTLPDPLPAGAASVQLGVVERMDTAYLNGKWTGASAWVENPRNYPVADGVLKPGKNIVTVRVLKTKPNGGFMSKPEILRLVLGDGAVIPLAGDWKGAVSVDARPPHAMPLGFENWPVMPSVLYEGMIEPIAPLAIKGAIWYQGEANTAHAYQYRTLLPAMIGDWRALFGQGDFPFYIVSLSGVHATPWLARRRFLGRDARSTGAHRAKGQELRAGGDHRYRRSGQYSSQRQIGCGRAAGVLRTGADVW